MKPKVIFVYPATSRDSVPPLLGSLEKAELLDEIEVHLVTLSEANVIDSVSEVISQTRNSKTKTIIAVSFLTPEVKLVGRFVELVKTKIKEKALFVAGGPHASGDPLGTLKLLSFDIVIVGEGERSFVDLVNNFIVEEELYDVRGLAYLDPSGELTINESLTPVNLDEYPPYSLTLRICPNSLEIMRGCPFTCEFCQTPRLMGFRPRYRSIKAIIEILEVYVKEFKRRRVKFLAPNGFAYGSKSGTRPELEKLEDLLEAVKSVEGIKEVHLGVFPSEVRPDFVTPEVLEVVSKYIDNRKLCIGAQSGSDRVLEKVRRGHDVETWLKAVNLAVRFGFRPYVDFLFGLPYEIEDDLKLTLKAMRELMRRRIKMRAHTFMPLPGTPLWRFRSKKLPKWFKERLNKWERGGYVEGDYRIQEEKINPIIEEYKKELFKLTLNEV